ncbi:Astacin-like metalloendopeptidase [Strongyloides ratti]|uniref:Metalloendopeptidase n=1 Tax=Strongyloides ratti TaxID=34506 RepID=A0A090L0Q6_STRRB|nr:Astacin-like metalloendopeptidase [Strongyloides ratti]CEF61682.2 Astacin-like metalloendopeptidase [Strongyloides ratti]
MILIYILILLINIYPIRPFETFDIQKNNFRNKRAALRNPTRLWKEKIIYYKISAALKVNTNLKNVFEEISKRSCLDFKEIDEYDNSVEKKCFFLKIDTNNYGTHFGKKLDTQQCQFIYFDNKNVSNVELMRWVFYGLGFDFEHNRPDRDDYFLIHKNNIQKKFLPYVKKRSKRIVNTFGIDINPKNIMTLRENEYAINPSKKTFERTYVKEDNRFSFDLLTHKDTFLINKHYCEKRCNPSFMCVFGGTPDYHNCDKCFCPGSLGGKYCQLLSSEVTPKCMFSDLKATRAGDGFNKYLAYDCDFSITSAPGTIIELSYYFYDESIPLDYNCHNDNGYVEIKLERDKSSPGIILCYFGKKGTFYSEDNYVIVHMRGVIKSRVVRLMYKEVDPNEVSKGKIERT